MKRDPDMPSMNSWHLGLTQAIFQNLTDVESSSQLQANDPHGSPRVRLTKPRSDDF
ncbi:hypothetical protein [Pseudomonas sp.]|uniref:hypothetical protein n=1 Tax=Pseudomonas sp. TaxID=306 RepID=UPI00261AECDF|nr:hypothetical protein [Pseudomonas sp.]